MRIDLYRAFALAFTALAIPAPAQTTTEFTGSIELSGNETHTERYIMGFAGAGTAGTLGPALVLLNASQQLGPDYRSGVGPIALGLTLAFNRQDQIAIGTSGVPDPATAQVTINGRVNSGSGVYAGATGPASGVSVTLTRTSTSPPRYNVSMTGTATVGGQALDLAFTNVAVARNAVAVNLFDDEPGTATFTPLGNATVNARSRPNTDRWDDNVKFIEILLTFTFSPSDSLQALLVLDVTDPEKEEFRFREGIIAGGTGRFAGAAGAFRVLNLDEGAGGAVTVTVSGSITQTGPTTPIINFVNTASGLNPISQNDWIEIKGINLVPKDTPAGGVFWSNAPEFAQGRMPTELGGVSVTVNGQPAYVWWYCSAATTPACATDQINVLTPLDDYIGQVPIVVRNGPAASGAFLRRKFAATPSLLLFTAKGDAVATHADGSLLGPATLFPGASTPARGGETVSLWGVGFGLPATPLTGGSSTQRGELPAAPACSLGGAAVQVAAALVSPGLYQLNITIPGNAAAGNNHLYCTYGDGSTPGTLIAVQ